MNTKEVDKTEEVTAVREVLDLVREEISKMTDAEYRAFNAAMMSKTE